MNVAPARTPPRQIEDGLPIPRRYWSAAAIWLALAMAVLDGSIANVALPTIAKDLGASAATSVWIVNAYQLTITMLLLPLAALGDKLGYRRIYIPGLALFTLGSLGCAMAHSLEGLIVARVFQGLGAAGIMSMNAALVRATYPADMLGRGIGYNALVWEPRRPLYGLNEPTVLPEEELTLLPAHLNGRAHTIFGGTSEIQHEIIAKQMLGL